MDPEDPRVRNVEARRGFFPIVTGDEVSLQQAGAGVCISRGDLSLTQAGTRSAMARGNLTIHEGGGMLLGAGGDVSINEGGAAVIAARNARLERSFVGMVIGPGTQISADSKLLLGPRQAAIFGAVAGLVCAAACGLAARYRGR